ncbi:MAG: hypothetical protein K9N21_19210 [Deltaproteobacteria bacterium]|nr:hypothetical protein [Deltaproteobacteria bacterium]
MKHLILFLIVLLAAAACTPFSGPETLGEFKNNIHCLEYKQGMPWNEIKNSLGTPEVTPIPQIDSGLSQNARIYKGKTVIFYTKPQKIEKNGKMRFEEVVYKIEVCK